MSEPSFAPSYLALLENGELEKRVKILNEMLKECNICPRKCKANRLNNESGCCRTGKNAMVASYCVHRGEEPPISGTTGSGTIFFAMCNLACIYCQNYEISQEWVEGEGEVTINALADIYLELQSKNVHNINWVSPSHVVPQAVDALLIAAQRGLSIPIVYNSNGYDAVETIKLLDGIVDIYMPDFKYLDDEIAKDLSNAESYSKNAIESIKEMWRQVGKLKVDENGVARRGLLVRHLVLPHKLSQSENIIEYLAKEISPDIALSLMSQYYPTHLAKGDKMLCRPLLPSEYSPLLDTLDRLGIREGFVQDISSFENYRPDFKKGGNPFEQ